MKLTPLIPRGQPWHTPPNGWGFLPWFGPPGVEKIAWLPHLVFVTYFARALGLIR